MNLTRTLAAFVISLAVTLIVGRFLIPFLRRAKAGQSIKRDGPVWHMSKEGTPTMGGLMFIAGMLAAVLIACIREMREGDWSAPAMLLFAMVQGAIGFTDDLEKIRKHGNQGLTGWQKSMLQLVVAVAFVLLLRYIGYLSPNLYIPFFNTVVPLPEPVYVAFCAFVILGTVNAVNLTDGVDGLVSGVSLPVAVCFAVLAITWRM